MNEVCEHTSVEDILDPDTGQLIGVRCRNCGKEAFPGSGPEDEPDSDSEGEDETDEPSGIKPGDAESIGERIRETVERETITDEPEPSVAGQTTEPFPPPDPYTETCPTCDGWGETQTGSRVDANLFRHCVDCGGKGWRDKVPTYNPPETVSESASAPAESSPGQWNWPQANLPPLDPPR